MKPSHNSTFNAHNLTVMRLFPVDIDGPDMEWENQYLFKLIIADSMINFKRLYITARILPVMTSLFILRTYLSYFDHAGLLSEDIDNTSMLSGIAFLSHRILLPL